MYKFAFLHCIFSKMLHAKSVSGLGVDDFNKVSGKICDLTGHSVWLQEKCDKNTLRKGTVSREVTNW